MKHNRRSQVQLLESVSVTVIVIILIVIGIAFWSRMNQGNNEDDQVQYDELSTIELAKTISEIPELRCFQTAEYRDVNCFDYYKIKALNDSMHEESTKEKTFDYYNNYFRNSRITFQILYPIEENITIYDNNISIQKSLKVSIPVIIEKKLSSEGTRMFGYILVEGYFR